MLTKIIIYCKCKVNKTNEKEKILVLTSNKGVEQMKWLVAGMQSEFVEDFISSKFAKTLHKLLQPRCPNGHRCLDCVYCHYIFDGIQFKGIYCNIDAK